jgi:hypothetical protein
MKASSVCSALLSGAGDCTHAGTQKQSEVQERGPGVKEMKPGSPVIDIIVFVMRLGIRPGGVGRDGGDAIIFVGIMLKKFDSSASTSTSLSSLIQSSDGTRKSARLRLPVLTAPTSIIFVLPFDPSMVFVPELQNGGARMRIIVEDINLVSIICQICHVKFCVSVFLLLHKLMPLHTQ